MAEEQMRFTNLLNDNIGLHLQEDPVFPLVATRLPKCIRVLVQQVGHPTLHGRGFDVLEDFGRRKEPITASSPSRVFYFLFTRSRRPGHELHRRQLTSSACEY